MTGFCLVLCHWFIKQLENQNPWVIIKVLQRTRTVFTPHTAVVFPNFTSADPSAVEMDPTSKHVQRVWSTLIIMLSFHTFIIYRPPTVPSNHQLTIYQPTNHLPATYWPPTDHLPTTYQPTTYQPPTNHLPTNHLPTTHRPPTNQTTYRPPTDHLPTTYWPPTDHLPSDHLPTNHQPSTYWPLFYGAAYSILPQRV